MTTLIRPLVAALAAALLVGAPAATAAESPPETSGAAAIVVDARTGDELYGKDPREERPIASTTKLMTALLTLERADLDDVFKAAPYSASPVESKIGLMPGERMTVEDLLTALVLESANDAAVTLAEGVAGSRDAFVREMNRRAVALGLRDTSYANPVGFDDPENYSSARDLAELARRLLTNPSSPASPTCRWRRSTAATTSARSTTATPRPGVPVRGRRKDRSYDRRRLRARGIRSGRRRACDHGDARRSERSGARRRHTGAACAGASSSSIASAYCGPARSLEQIDVNYRDEDAEVGAARPVTLVLRRGERTETVLDAPDELDGPLAKGERVGSVAVVRKGETVRRVPLVTLDDVEGASFARKVVRTLGTLLIVLLVVGIFLAVLVAVRRRRGIA